MPSRCGGVPSGPRFGLLVAVRDGLYRSGAEYVPVTDAHWPREDTLLLVPKPSRAILISTEAPWLLSRVSPTTYTLTESLPCNHHRLQAH